MTEFDHPFIVFAIALIAQALAAYVGVLAGSGSRRLSEDQRKDFDLIQGATLTLLGLIIGFSFSMAVTRYDQRKNYEEAEANAIGTEYVRADLLLPEDSTRVRELIRRYLDQRIAFYRASDRRALAQIDKETTELDKQLWSAILRSANTMPNPITALAVSGMNDLLNSQSYTQAAWWNRIPVSAWGLMALIAVASNMMVGYGARHKGKLVFALPIIVAMAFLLIADIDSPRGGIIRVLPQNLLALSQSMTSQ